MNEPNIRIGRRLTNFLKGRDFNPEIVLECLGCIEQGLLRIQSDLARSPDLNEGERGAYLVVVARLVDENQQVIKAFEILAGHKDPGEAPYRPQFSHLGDGPPPSLTVARPSPQENKEPEKEQEADVQ